MTRTTQAKWIEHNAAEGRQPVEDDESHAVRAELTPEQEAAIDKAVGVGEYTGGSVSYYTVSVSNPTNPDRDPYEAECNDIIESLNMNYAEGNAFKAIWRKCAARLGKQKKGYTDGLYDAQKVAFFGERMVSQCERDD